MLYRILLIILISSCSAQKNQTEKKIIPNFLIESGKKLILEKEEKFISLMLILGSFSGIPSPPAFLSLNLLPHLEKEIRVMLSRSKNIDDPLGDIFSVFDVG